MTATLQSAKAMGSARDARGLEALAAARGQTAAVTVPVKVRTRLFGALALGYTLPMRGGGEGTRVAWSRSLLFPGMRRGEELSRQTQLPERAALLARDGSTLASGSATAAGQRESPLGAAALRCQPCSATNSRSSNEDGGGHQGEMVKAREMPCRAESDRLAARPGHRLGPIR